MFFNIGEPLLDYKKRMIKEIDTEAGELRGKFITIVPGQEMSYLEKRAEAEKYFANPKRNVKDMPIIEGESLVLGTTLQSVALDVIVTSHEWIQLERAINQVRMGHGASIMLSQNASQVRAARKAATEAFKLIEHSLE